jgi:hypothetical protein
LSSPASRRQYLFTSSWLRRSSASSRLCLGPPSPTRRRPRRRVSFPAPSTPLVYLPLPTLPPTQGLHRCARVRPPRGRSPYHCHRIRHAQLEGRSRTAPSGEKAEHHLSSSLLGRSAAGRRPHRPPLPTLFSTSSGRSACWSRGAAQAHPIEIRHWVSPSLPSFVSVVDRREDKVGKGGKLLGAPRDCTRGLPSAVVLFFLVFPDLLSGFRHATIRHRSSSTLLKTRLLMSPPGCSDDARGQAIYWCRRLLRRWRYSPSVFVKQVIDLPLHFQPFSRGHRCRCS